MMHLFESTNKPYIPYNVLFAMELFWCGDAARRRAALASKFGGQRGMAVGVVVGGGGVWCGGVVWLVVVAWLCM